MELRIKYHADIKPLKQVFGCDWIDLRAAVDTVLLPGEFQLIPLGVSIELPENHEAQVVPRSSTYKNWGIIQANSCGIIDESYRGDNDQWFMPVINISAGKTWINKNDRICQFRIMKKQPQLDFEVVDFLDNENRGGFGSTGKR